MNRRRDPAASTGKAAKSIQPPPPPTLLGAGRLCGPCILHTPHPHPVDSALLLGRGSGSESEEVMELEVPMAWGHSDLVAASSHSRPAVGLVENPGRGGKGGTQPSDAGLSDSGDDEDLFDLAADLGERFSPDR